MQLLVVFVLIFLAKRNLDDDVYQFGAVIANWQVKIIDHFAFLQTLLTADSTDWDGFFERRIKTLSSKSVRSAVILLFAGPANGDAIYLQGRDSYAYWDGLAVFAAGAHAFVQFQVAANHRHTREDVRAIADQRGILNGSGNLAVLDHVRF